MEGLKQKLEESVTFVRQHTSSAFKVGMILGTGLGSVADNIIIETTIPYEEIPHFKPSHVQTHAGELVLGTLAGVPIVVMKGRFH